MTLFMSQFTSIYRASLQQLNFDFSGKQNLSRDMYFHLLLHAKTDSDQKEIFALEQVILSVWVVATSQL